MTDLSIVSGGQTGVDRAALDVALELGLPCGGWVPKDRIAEDGLIDARYPMRETGRTAYFVRTRLNVRDSDATLVLTRGQPTGGTALTIDFAKRSGRPCRVLDLDIDPDPDAVRGWLDSHRVRVFNVAGSRESTSPGIYGIAAEFLRRVLSDR